MRKTEFRTKKCTSGVNLQHEIESLEISRIRPSQLNRARVINQNIDPTKGLSAFRDRRRNLFIGSNIYRQRQRLPTSLFNLFRSGINRPGQPRMRRRCFRHNRNVSPVSRRP
jgi:hypothetical protein